MSHLLSAIREALPSPKESLEYSKILSAFLSGSISVVEFHHYARSLFPQDSSTIGFSCGLVIFLMLVYLHNNFITFLLYYCYGCDGDAAPLHSLMSSLSCTGDTLRELEQLAAGTSDPFRDSALDSPNRTLCLSSVRLEYDEILRLESQVYKIGSKLCLFTVLLESQVFSKCECFA